MTFSKRLYKSRTDKIIDGVCGGLGEYLGIDPTLIRLAWAAAFFLGGFGLLAYIAAMIIIPVKPEPASSERQAQPIAGEGAAEKDAPSEPTATAEQSAPPSTPAISNVNGKLIGGIILVGMGILFLLDNFFSLFTHFSFGELWPLFLVAIGIMILAGSRGDGKNAN